MNYYFDVLKKYTVFNGRAGRPEYWYFVLVNLIINIGLGIIERGSNTNVLSNLYSLAVFLPCLAVSVRRLHDVNKSGWFLLIPIYDIVLLARKSDQGDNRFGGPVA